MKTGPAIVAIPLLVALLTWLSVRAINDDAEHFDKALAELERLSTTEAALHRDVLSARAGLLRNYDPLIRDVNAVDASLRKLRRTAAVDSETAASIDRLAMAIEAQEDVVEQFKTNNALLKNSLSYFDLFSSRLIPADLEAPRIPAVGALAAAMLRLTLDTSPENAADVEDRLRDLAAQPVSQTDADVSGLLLHGRLLHDLLPATDALLSELCAAPRKQDQEAVRKLILARQLASRDTARRFRIALYGISLLLVGVLVQLGLQLRARTLAIRRRAALEHVIARISIRLINASPQEIDQQIEAALAELAHCVRADRAYWTFGSPVNRTQIWHRDGSPFPPGWPDAVRPLAARFGLASDGIVHIPDVMRLGSTEDELALARFGVRGWACVAGICAGNVTAHLGFDAVQRPYRISALGELGLLRMALDAIMNAVARQYMGQERERLETRLRQARRMETVGAFASGIAHNFNNIVGAILGYAEIAEGQVVPGTPAARSVEEIRRGGERARALVDQILTFGRTRDTRRTAVNIPELIGEAAALLRGSLPKAIELSVRPITEPIAVAGDDAQLQQVVLNLSANAARAMDGRGRIEVMADAQELTSARSLSHGKLAPGRYVRLAVHDDGCGIEEGALRRIFEPFFSTHPDGNGLGLATVREIVHEHGGAMNVQSTCGVGSRFEAWLPVLSPAQAADEPATPLLGRGETILVVNGRSADLLRDEEVLAALCYEPVGFTRPDAALAAYRTAPGRFDAFVIGRLGPPKAALELAAALPPRLPILLAAPSSEEFDVDQLAAAGISDVVHEPVVATEIAAVLGRLLARQRTSGAPAAVPYP